jgi:hypothetical protein
LLKGLVKEFFTTYLKRRSHCFSFTQPLSVFMCYSSRMSSQRENQPSVNGSSSNAAATRLFRVKAAATAAILLSTLMSAAAPPLPAFLW